jgi:hypothetical protein
MNPLRVFLGYDSREPTAWHVLAHSILRRASRPVSITPLALNQLAGWLYTRERTSKESTEFSFTRFLVPYLSGFTGTSIFMDSDMLAFTDLWEVHTRINWSAAVWVVKHDYTPQTDTKMWGAVQTAYPRKNWSSFVVFNNARCRALTPEYVNRASGLELHRFKWLHDAEIGALPKAWNYLVGETNQADPPHAIVHFTNGTPCLPGYETCEYAKEWFAERDHMLTNG